MSEIKVDKDTRNIADLQHNHFTRDVKEWGECPACDDYHKSELIRKYKSRIAQQEEIIKELKNILLDAGAKTHKSKMLYDWYCENAEEIIGDKNE